jgi:hypothetical protein
LSRVVGILSAVAAKRDTRIRVSYMVDVDGGLKLDDSV